ncbi:MAG: hypothetical protein QM640_17455 [Niabella sp.]
MQQPHTPPARCFLTRLAMNAQADPAKTDPFCSLRHIFKYMPVHEICEELDLICAAAMNEEYVWAHGSPGNCLYYSGRLELLIECCYLIRTTAQAGALTGRKPPALKKIPVKMLPVPLTAGEFNKPLRVIKSFFRHASLPEWKRQLLVWTENALSRSSVKDELAPETLFPFMKLLRKLVYAACLLCK